MSNNSGSIVFTIEWNAYIIFIMSIPARPKYIVLSILFVLATINFTKTTVSILESSKRLDSLKGEVTQLEARQAQLRQELAYKKTDSFIEEEARNKLNMAKVGEEVFIFPQIVEGKVLGSHSSTTSGSLAIRAKPIETNFQRWVRLLL